MSLSLPNRRGLAAPLLPLGLERQSSLPLQRQLYEQIREVILAGRLAPGARLPSSRALARELHCSRTTVIGAYDQLLSEGYLEGQPGAGTFVSRVLPEELLGAPPARGEGGDRRAYPGGDRAAPRSPGLSRRGYALAALRRDRRAAPRAFTPGVPETVSFPYEVWARLFGRIWRRPPDDLLHHGAAAGYLPLRRAIAQYLKGARGLDCDADRVIITSGAQQSLDLVARCLLDPDDEVWIEEPGYGGLHGPLLAAGARLCPVPLDDEGLSLAAGLDRAPRARMVCVAPAHQYPLGIVMSLARRLALLDWARAGGTWILEDDYDSEYRYAGKPLAALQDLDGSGRVIYMGSFSKVLFPSIRIGYLVVPEALADPVIAVRSALEDHPSSLAQPVLAAFIEEGHFAAHVRRMRTLYDGRQRALLAAAERHLDGLVDLGRDDAGLHLVGKLGHRLAGRLRDIDASARAAAAGIDTPALSSFFHETPRAEGLLLGYAAVPESAIEAGVAKLAAALRAN